MQKINTKTLVRYRNFIPAKVIERATKNKVNYLKISWTHLPYSKNKKHFKWVKEEDCEVVKRLSLIKKVIIKKFKKRISYMDKIKFTPLIQKVLWYIGISIHNFNRNECTPDFNCCNKIGRKKWFNITQKDFN